MSYLVSFNTFADDKTVVFTKPKVASRVCDMWFSEQKCEVQLDVNKPHFTIGHGDDEYYETILKSLFDKKKNKRDVYFLYRHPQNRLYSGIYQEFVAYIENADDVTLYTLSRRFKNHKLCYDFLKLKNYNFNWHSLPGQHEWTKFERTILKTLVEDFVIALDESKTFFSRGHTENYLTGLYTMISSGLFDSNKVKLVDIENNDLERVFGKWKQLPQKSNNKMPRNDWFEIDKRALKNEFIFQLVMDNAGKQQYSQVISQGLSLENYFYNLILNHPQNIILK